MDTSALLKEIAIKRMGMSEEQAEKFLGNGEPSLRKGNCTEEKEEASFKRADCTQEIYEIKETQETDEAEEAEELQETHGTDDLDPRLWTIINPAISECRVGPDKGFNRPLFMLAHKVRGLELTLKRQFSVAAASAIVRRWQSDNQSHLDLDRDYLAEFLDKLSLVRFPRGRALFDAYEAAKKQSAPKQTTDLSSDVQLLACLCRELQRRAGTKPFFLAGRPAARVLGKPHETVASWLRALQRAGVIWLVDKGRRGSASRYRYIPRD